MSSSKSRQTAKKASPRSRPKKSTRKKSASGTKGSGSPKGGFRRHSGTCVECGAEMVTVQGPQTYSVNGETVRVPKAEFLRCTDCKSVAFRFDQLRHLREAAFAKYREANGLLSADEIRSLRERHNLTQADFARILRVGQNTLSRWEANRNVQSASLNSLLELIRDVPGTLEYLESRAA